MQTTIKKAFDAAQKRLILLDYDGTLREFEVDPLAAVPTPEIRSLLTRLGTLPNTTTVLISGRDQGTMQTWFSDLPVSLVAEHGFFIHEPGADWQPAFALDASWKPPVRAVLEEYAAKLPGSSIEEKHSALAWHYRAADSAAAAAIAPQTLIALKTVQANHPIEIVPGHSVIEVHVPGVNKGTAAARWLDQPWDFIVAAGDDNTDEDLFKVMPAGAFTLKVGSGDTTAQHRVDSPAAMRELLISFL